MIRFDQLDRWYTDLSPSEQDEIHELKARKAPTPSERILPISHGKTIEDQVQAGKVKFLSTYEPFSLIRLGDFELGLLGALYFPFGKASNDVHTMMIRAGYASQEAFLVRRHLIAAVRLSALVGVLENWDTQKIETAALMSMLDCQIPCSRAVEIHLPYAMLVDGTLFSWLSGRRVLLIGNLAPRLFDAWKTPAFHRAYERFGPSDKVNVVGAIPMSSREDGGSCKDFNFVLKCAQRRDYDVALIASGAVAKPLAYLIWRMGRTALDVGFVFDALVREREDARVGRPILRDASFPALSW